MDPSEKDKTPMLPLSIKSDAQRGVTKTRNFPARTTSTSMSVRSNSLDPYEYMGNPVGPAGPSYVAGNNEVIFQLPQLTLEQKAGEPKLEKYSSFDVFDSKEWQEDNYGGKNENLLKSGPLGMCDDPYCTTCPMYYDVKGHRKLSRMSETFDAKFHNMLYGDAKSLARRVGSFLQPYIPGVMNPHAKIVQQWNKFFVISCLFAVFMDPLFFFLLSVLQENKCIILDWTMTTTIVALRSMTDFIYFLHIVLQFRLAYVAPESRVMGAGELADDPKKIARHYLFGYFILDFFVVLPLPQRVNQCFRDACHGSNVTRCMEFIDCGHGDNIVEFETDPTWSQWLNNVNASACFDQNGFAYGIYQNAIPLTTNENFVTRYVYSLFWGFQQISTLAGNQVPSYFVWEVLFTMAIIGIGLLLFAILIGNMQNFLQSLGRRRLEMSLRRRDVEQWMSHRRLPEGLRSLVREAERFNWAATRGVNEEMLMENLPEDLQRDIRRHLFKFVKRVRIFQVLEEPIIDAICERLRTKTYIKGSKIIYRGGLIDKMVFIIRGKMESVGEDLTILPLSEGEVCGEELLTWCLEHSSVNKDGKRVRIPGPRLLSNRIVRCLTNVEAFILRAADLEEVTSLFARFLRSPRVQGAIRYESPYWRGLAARRIQVAWRYQKKRTIRDSLSLNMRSSV